MTRSLRACLDEIAATTEPHTVIESPDQVVSYVTDWTQTFGPTRSFVVRPASTSDAQIIVNQCQQHNVPIVPQGGNTGLVGGSVPESDGCILISTSRLSTIGPVDLATGQVTAEAGVTLSNLAQHLRGTGWRYGVDVGSRDSATIGGTIATNAGGTGVFAHGATRQQVLGLEYVLADGSVLSNLGGLVKNNTGYALDHLMCGSEGTLGLITAARLRLIPEVAHRVTATIGFVDAPAALNAAWELRRTAIGAEAIEFVSAECRRLVAETLNLKDPLGSAPSLVVEVAGTTDLAESLAGAIANLDGVTEVVVASNSAQRDLLWRFREEITTVLPNLGRVEKFDVSLPHGQVTSFVAELTQALSTRSPGSQLWLFGHVCDDNFHVNVTHRDDGNALRPDTSDIADLVYGLVAAFGGSISAEHGIGRLKRDRLYLTRSQREIDAMAAIRKALDPDSLFNPGAIFASSD